LLTDVFGALSEICFGQLSYKANVRLVTYQEQDEFADFLKRLTLPVIALSITPGGFAVIYKQTSEPK
jgi:ABC-type dipeptide/oligopeptide/nickel transport system permease component